MTTTPTGNARPPVTVSKPGALAAFRRRGWKHLAAAAIVVYAVFPLLYAFSAAFGSGGTLVGSNKLFSSISLDNFRDLFSDTENPFMRWFLNSLFVSTTTAVGTVLMGAAAVYAFSRFNFRGRKGGLMSLLVIQMFPQLLAFVAIFLMLATISDIYPFLGLNTHLGLIMIYLGGALGANTFLMYGVFNTVPRELDEAARVDGATHSQIYWGIILRLITPILVVVGLLSFIASFSDFLLARIVLQDPDKWTVAVGLYNFVAVEFGEKWGVFTAGAVVSALPVVILFLFLQRYIVSGLTGGAVKG